MIEILGAGWVRFRFTEVVDGEVFLVGDFNDWNERSHAMQREEDGSHTMTLRLDPGEYEFKYRVGNIWFNDDCAHKYVQNVWGSENSVAVVPGDPGPPHDEGREAWA